MKKKFLIGLGILLGTTLLYYVVFLTYAILRPVEYHEGPAPEVTFEVRKLNEVILKEGDVPPPEQVFNAAQVNETFTVITEPNLSDQLEPTTK